MWNGVLMDITEQKLFDVALRESEILLEKAQAISKIGHWKLNPITGDVCGSDELFHIFEIRREDASLETFINVVHPDDREMDVAAIQRGTEFGECWDIEHRLLNQDGKVKWVHAVGEAIKDDSGNIIELVGTAQDITKEKLIDLELERSNLRFKSMFESIPDAIIYADPERKIRMVNQAAIELFGFDEIELQGNETKMLYASADDFKQQGLKRFNPNSKRTSSPNIITYKCKNGNEFSGETVGTAVKTVSGDILGYLGIIRDITEKKLLEAELEHYRDSLESEIAMRTSELIQARDEAEHANKAKSDFLSSMSHELRTPLNAILGFGQLLELNNSGFSKVQKNNVNEILEAGNHLLNLINEVLDLAKIEAGKIEINMKAVDVSEIIRECLKLMNSSIDKRNVEVIDNIKQHQYFVSADEMRLKQILLNLISNAVKYNIESGKLILDVRVKADYLHICVTDTGKGLSKSEIDRLFNPFERMNVEENIEGTGIGLTITKHLSELMGGRVDVESSPGKGSTFWVELELINNYVEEE